MESLLICHLSDEWSDYDEIWYTESDSDYDNNKSSYR